MVSRPQVTGSGFPSPVSEASRELGPVVAVVGGATGGLRVGPGSREMMEGTQGASREAQGALSSSEL